MYLVVIGLQSSIYDCFYKKLQTVRTNLHSEYGISQQMMIILEVGCSTSTLYLLKEPLLIFSIHRTQRYKSEPQGVVRSDWMKWHAEESPLLCFTGIFEELQ